MSEEEARGPEERRPDGWPALEAERQNWAGPAGRTDQPPSSQAGSCSREELFESEGKRHKYDQNLMINKVLMIKVK